MKTKSIVSTLTGMILAPPAYVDAMIPSSGERVRNERVTARRKNAEVRDVEIKREAGSSISLDELECE